VISSKNERSVMFTTTAEQLARHAHRDQVDRAGKPYIEHVERVVANLLRRWPDATEDEVAAAWLHYTIEDTEWDADLLRTVGIPASAVSIVEEVSRPAGSTYRAWIQSLAALGSLSAVRVKLADNEDNISPERVASIPEGGSMLKKRYLPAKKMLEGRIADIS
jgi:(p)ppGpp synthase/HD superfamily hydrolase